MKSTEDRSCSRFTWEMWNWLHSHNNNIAVAAVVHVWLVSHQKMVLHTESIRQENTVLICIGGDLWNANRRNYTKFDEKSIKQETIGLHICQRVDVLPYVPPVFIEVYLFFISIHNIPNKLKIVVIDLVLLINLEHSSITCMSVEIPIILGKYAYENNVNVYWILPLYCVDLANDGVLLHWTLEYRSWIYDKHDIFHINKQISTKANFVLNSQ